MALCGSRGCNCAFEDSASIAVSGSGTAADPYSFSGSLTLSPNYEIFTANGTWTKPANLKAVIVEVVGGGGGSGGCEATGASQCSPAGSGGGGGYARKLILAADLGGTESVVVGAGGTAGAAGANDGGAGGTSSFGAHCSASGGGGGFGNGVQTASNLVLTSNSSGGIGSGGDVNIPGSASGHTICNSAGTRIMKALPGRSFYSPGRRGILAVTSSNSGAVGDGYGGGALGATNVASDATARAGAVGAPGIVIVHEFF